MRRMLALLAFAVLAGCAGPEAPNAPSDAAPNADGSTPAALVTQEPLQFGAPVRVASSGPALYLNSLAEASVAVLPDDVVIITASGCDKGAPHLGSEDLDLCLHSPVYRSRDGGASWTRLNQGADSHLVEGAPMANSDSVVRTDAAGHLYYLSMQTGGALVLFRSDDGGDSWRTMPAPAASPDRDRPWLDAVGDGVLAAAWHEDGTLKAATSSDGAETWSAPKTVVSDVMAYGGPRIAPDSGAVYLPYLAQPAGSSLKVAAFTGAAWSTLDTGIVLPEPAKAGMVTTGSQGWIQSIPGLAISPAGHLLLTWDQEGHGTVVTMVRGYAVVMASLSVDGGLTWSTPVEVGGITSLMPWAEALPSGQFAVAYYASDLIPGDPDYFGSWRFEVAQVAEGPRGLKVVDRVVVDEQVRLAGGICSGGGNCLFKGADRSLLDINELAVGPLGEVVVAYGAEDLAAGKASTIRFAGPKA